MKLLTPFTKKYPIFDDRLLATYLRSETARYKHVLGVVRCMEEILQKIDIDITWKPLLIQACYLHDIGYSDKLNQFDFHPLDGAIFAQNQGFPKPVIAAVLFHSCAYESAIRIDDKLKHIYQENLSQLDQKDHLFIDLVTYCDLHTSVTGERTTLPQRVNHVIDRYGEKHMTSQLMLENLPTYEEITRRVTALIRS